MQEEKKTMHFISHTHWDREWYMPFEAHRFKLVEFFDRLLDTLDTDPTFQSFHLDGQAIVIEDYLEVRPQMREKIEKYIAEGRLVCGPWYILQDEYLVDGESNVRNMLIGKQVSAQYGKVSNIGYFPDAFGNIGQAPQILRGFGIDCVAFGRGVSERKGDRLDTGEENYGKATSEIRWRSPDGSEVVGAVFLNWYNNATELPEENTTARLDAIRQNCERFATTPHLLCMNGCDHQPVQADIGQLLEREGKTYPHTLVHSNFRDYFDAILPYKDRFGIFVGELDGEYSNGWHTLANTASSRIYLKQWNTLCENLLERQAEPMAVAAQLYTGKPADRDYFHFLWKMLLQNHPHDSICGCSVDAVHTEMVTRFQKVQAAGTSLLKKDTETVCAAIHTVHLDGEKAITVWNPMGRTTCETVTVHVDFPKEREITAEALGIYDGDKRIPATIEDQGIQFDYILPIDAFRQPIFVRRFQVTFRACDLPPVGYKTYAVRTDAEQPDMQTDLKVQGRRVMNRYLTLFFQKDGSVRVYDKRSKSTYTTGIFLDTGDVGDEYIYRESADQVRVTTEGKTAKLEMVSCDAAAVTIKVVHTMEIPADVDLENGCRIGSTAQVIECDYTLRAGAERLDVRTVIHNTAKNHRITMLTKNDIQTELVMAEGQYDIVKRPITPWEGWTNPSRPGKLTTFFGLEEEKRGLLIAGKGLAEYEILRDGANTMALTVHRGIDRMNGWGVGMFYAPEGQCLGDLTVEYALIPYACRNREAAVNAAYSFASTPFVAMSADIHEGTIPATDSLISMEGKGFVVSAVKPCETRDSVICRVFQPYDYDTKMVIHGGDRYAEAWLTDLNEDRLTRIPKRNGKFFVPVGKKKIVTVELIPAVTE